MTQIEVVYEGGLHCRARHPESDAVIYTDAPLDNHGRGEAFSPTDLVGTSLATCMVTIMAMAAERHGIDCRGVRVVVDKTMSTGVPRRISKLEVNYYIPLAADHPQRELLEKAALNCPVKQSLHPDIEQKIQFHWGASS